nr:glycosyltransferase [Flavihumibacter fluvii]
MTTYNHSSYIARAIEGVLMQKTSFDFNIVIGEDCSNDNTRAIVQDFKEKYPDKIITFFPKANLGMARMFFESYTLCTGKYIAWLDGDDYWTDDYKLQKQVDFLEANAEFVMTFHRIKYLDEFEHKSYTYHPPSGLAPDDSLGPEGFYKGNPIVALSVVHRNVLGSALPAWIGKLPHPDLAFYFLLLQYGRVKYLDEEMGVYRIHESGAWSGVPGYYKREQLAFFYRKIGKYIDIRNNTLFKKSVYPIFTSILDESIQSGYGRNSVIYFFYLLRNYPQFRMDKPALYRDAVKFLRTELPKKILSFMFRKE